MLFVLGITFACSKNFNVHASELSNEEILLSNGFTSNIVYKLSEYTKEELVKQICNSNSFNHEIMTLSETNDSEIQTRGQIPDDDLTIIITTEILTVEADEVKEIKVKIYYEWENLPTWRLEDPIIVCWDHEKLTYKPGSFYSEDRYYREDDGDALHISRTNLYSKNNDTLCWYADLKAGYFLGIGGTIDRLYGFGEFILEPNEGHQFYGQSTIDTTYVHSKVAVEAGVSIYAEVGFEVPGTGNDQVTTDVRFNWNQPIYISPIDYGFEQQYFFYEKTLPITISGTTINTTRFRTGYIEEEYIVLSPRRENAGEAYLVYSFDTDIIQLNVDLTFWSSNEYLYSSDSTAVIQYKNSSGDWVTILDLLNDIDLPTDRTTPINQILIFPDETKEIRFYISTTAVGDRNKGRICIGDMELFLQR